MKGRAATVHLIHGYVCSGKTQFAKELQERTGAIRLSIDEWLTAISGDNRDLDDEFFERVQRLLMDLGARIAERGTDVILDFGFWRREYRDDVRARAAQVGAVSKLYWVCCPEEVARERCWRRNERIEQGDYFFDENAFDMLRSKFKPLDPDEPHEAIGTA